MILNYAFLQILCESVKYRCTFVGSIMTSKSKTTTMTTAEIIAQNTASRAVVKTVTTVVPCLQRKNGDWFANIENVEQPYASGFKVKTQHKTKRQANGKIFKSVTITSIWTVNHLYCRIVADWNEI